MFWRRYIVGLSPLLVWAETEEAADITAVVHAAALLPADQLPAWLPFGRVTDDE